MTPNYRLEVDYAYNVRAKKGERRERGTGRLIKALIYFGDDLRDCHTQAEATRDAMGTDGYATVVAVRGYDNVAYKVDPLKAVPNFVAPGLM
jgi:hypothetical protein